MKTLSKRALAFVLTIMFALGAGLAYADSADIEAAFNPDVDGTSNLYRHAYGIGMTAVVYGLRGGDGLPGGHPYTVWAVIFNNPSACAGYDLGQPCTEADFGNSATNTRVGQISRNYSDANGNGFFSGFMPEGGALVDSSVAEVHFIYRRHPDRNPEYASLNSFDGNCQFVNGELVDGPKNNQCEDEGFSIHQAPSPP